MAESDNEKAEKGIQNLTDEEMVNFTVTITPTDEWVVYKSPTYDPTTPSMMEGRFATSGVPAFYGGSGFNKPTICYQPLPAKEKNRFW
jgi:hypothetical protein